MNFDSKSNIAGHRGLTGDPTKAKEKLGWTPKISFDELVAEMVREDLKSAERDEHEFLGKKALRDYAADEL